MTKQYHLMNQKYKLAIPEFPNGWTGHCNEFYDIDPSDDVSDDDKFLFIFTQEDMIQIQNGEFLLDLGWYGGEDLDSPNSGYGLVLFRGHDWNNCELLENYRSKSKKDVVNRISALFVAVGKGFYENRKGLFIDENVKPYKGIGAYYSFTLFEN